MVAEVPRHLETLAVQGTTREHSEGSAVQPIFQSSTFLFQGEQGYDSVRYTRCNNNPNHKVSREPALPHSSCNSLDPGNFNLTLTSFLGFRPLQHRLRL